MHTWPTFSNNSIDSPMQSTSTIKKSIKNCLLNYSRITINPSFAHTMISSLFTKESKKHSKGSTNTKMNCLIWTKIFFSASLTANPWKIIWHKSLYWEKKLEWALLDHIKRWSSSSTIASWSTIFVKKNFQISSIKPIGFLSKKKKRTIFQMNTCKSISSSWKKK